MDTVQTLRFALAAALGLTACGGEPYTTEYCLDVPNDGVCLPADDVRKDIVGPGCGSRTVSVDGEAVLKVPDFWGADTAGNAEEGCCYPTTGRSINNGCIVGRPMVVDGAAAMAEVGPGSGWSAPNSPDVEALSARDRLRLADAWKEVAAGEHASIAAFSRLSLELIRLGAPSDLLQSAHQAALDEIAHARTASGIASAYASEAVAPGAVPLPTMLPLAATHAEVALAAAAEGCRDETLAALLALESARLATDPCVKAALTRIAEDETRHAGLSWRVLRWALEHAPEARPEVHRILTGPPPPVGQHRELSAHGVLGSEARHALYARGMAGVVRATWLSMA